ncbi:MULTISPECIES: ABC transporter ATP-binding protein [Desulfitobacterium]|uniref:ABC-type multidrug transport system, ATPase and permease component n=1 Tax=Desulfitobacterium dehalogenans (strain ATCC 51507 / DSM 9161 / JW/IU-DC1) TaxID=756499 RepID=I4A9L0_DESDJ|nr:MULTISPECIES: ABC transporter transmembrane domain-containing protein [Desulfitobacterium]AFM00645.1 ABC-type multidrug transport system, ATPase and permease component [Desulfitobacterium dehalogenans ATCC 51507]
MSTLISEDLEHKAGLAGQGKTILRLLNYLKPHIKALVFAFILLVLGTAADVAGPVLIKVFLDDYLTPRLLDPIPLILLGGGYLLLVILASFLQYHQLIRFNKIALLIIQQIRVDIFSKVQYLAMSVFDRTPAGALVSRVTNDTEAIKDLYIGVLSTYVQNIVFLLGIFIAMFSLDVRLAAFCLLLLPIIIGLMQIYRKISSKIYRISRAELSRLNAMLNESIQGMNIIQMMRQEKIFQKKFAGINEKYYGAAIANIKLESTLMRPAVDLLYTFALILVLGFFGLESIIGPVEVGVLYAFINYLDRFIDPVNMILMRLSQLQQAIIAAERVFEVLDDERTTTAFGLNSFQEADDSPTHTIEKGEIEFRDVSFSYDGVTEVLKNISFTVRPGETVALVGHTGSGKSTISNLLMKFYPVDEGKILIDGIPLKDFSQEELRTRIGLVAQDPFLFVGDIADNIHLNRPQLKEREVKAAAEFVEADKFINRLEKGYQEPVNERGSTLSSGQRQLICFARTIAGEPKILILDEATASVDTETEDAIQIALNKMRQGRSTIAIAHRLSTIQDADLILVLHQGQIVERGNHNGLLAQKGLYYKMFLLQQGPIRGH